MNQVTRISSDNYSVKPFYRCQNYWRGRHPFHRCHWEKRKLPEANGKGPMNREHKQEEQRDGWKDKEVAMEAWAWNHMPDYNKLMVNALKPDLNQATEAPDGMKRVGDNEVDDATSYWSLRKPLHCCTIFQRSRSGNKGSRKKIEMQLLQEEGDI